MGSDRKNSGGSGGRASGRGGAEAAFPVTTKKMVQSLKEIVNCPEQEIYAMLKECDMDPNDAVQRLLSQDTFHEVKSKRERRKEMKETQESRPRGNNNGSNGALRGGGERNVEWSGSNQINSNELGKAAHKQENGSVAPTLYSLSSFTYHSAEKTMPQQPLPHGDSFNADNRRQSTGTGEAISSSGQPSSGFQSVCLGAGIGHVSMADIVRMGRPHKKGTQMLTETSCTPQDATARCTSYYCVKTPHVPAPPRPELHQDLCSQNPSNMSEIINESGNTAEDVFCDEWPVIQQLTVASGSSVLDASAASDSEMYSKQPNQSNLSSDRTNLPRNYQSDEVHVSEEDGASENLHSGSRQMIVNSADGASHSDNDMLKDMRDMSTYDSQRQIYEHGEGIGSGSNFAFPNCIAPLTDNDVVAVSSAAVNLQHLNLGKEDPAVPPMEDNRAVVFPNHLQALAADCSHLSFGTYKSGNGSATPLKTDLEEASTAIDGSAAGHLNTSNSGYHGDGQLETVYDTQRANADARNYDSLLSSQPELTKQNIPQANHGHGYLSQSYGPDSIFENIQQPSFALPFAKADQQIRNIPPTSEMNAYPNSMLSELLGSTNHSVRDSDLLQSLFHATQSVPSRYSGAASSISSPTISTSEVLKSGAFSLPQPPSHNLPGAGLATGPVHPHHSSVHPYSQPTISLEQLANLIDYSGLPQRSSYMQSELEQAYPGSSSFDQSLAGMKYNLPQYNGDASLSGLPLSNANVSGYGGFGRSSYVPGSFLHNPSIAPTVTANGYDDALHSQYKDRNHFALHQVDSSPSWDYGPGSRTMSTVPASAYYGVLGQDQHHAGYRQGQQPSQDYGDVGFLDFYHSQTGIPQEHQRQSLGNLTSTGSQGPSSKQSHQVWQHSY